MATTTIDTLNPHTIRSRRNVIGRQAIYTTYEGERLVGTVGDHPMGKGRLAIFFEDGGWGAADYRLEIVNL